MKLRLPLLLWSALASLRMLPAQTFASESAGKVPHLYLIGARYACAMAMQQGIDGTEGGTLAVRRGAVEKWRLSQWVGELVGAAGCRRRR